MTATKMLSAAEWFADKKKVRLLNRCIPTIERHRSLLHDDYMEMCEDYADYVVSYEKQADRLR